MKNPLTFIITACTIALCTQAFAQVDTARRYNPNAEPNPGKILLDTSRIHSIPDSARSRSLDVPDRIVQPADTLGRKKRNPGIN